MKGKVQRLRLLTWFVFSIVISFSFSSCVDDKYDLDKDFAFEVNVGGDHLAIPLGFTDSIKLSKLFDLDDDAVLKAMPNGEYRVLISESVESDPFRIDAVELDDIESSSTSDLTLSFDGVGLDHIGVDMVQALTLSPLDIDVNNTIPNEIRRLTSVALGKADRVSEAVLRIAFTGFPTDLRQVDLVDFQIEFPEFMNLVPFDGGEWAGHVFTINDRIPVENDGSAEIVKRFKVISFDFAPDNDFVQYDESMDRTTLAIQDQIRFSGSLRVEDADVQAESFGRIAVQQHIAVTNLTASEVTGMVEPQIDPISKSIALDGLPDFILEEGVVLDVENPIVTVSVENPIDVPLRVRGMLASEKFGNIDSENAVDVQFDIQPAGNEPMKMTNVWISKDDTDKPTDYLGVRADLSKLVRQVPEFVNIDLEPKAIGEEHTFVLDQDYRVAVHYEVNVPLRFGADFKIVYKDVLDGIQDDLEDVFDKISAVEIIMDVENYIPLNMKLAVKPVDLLGEDLSGVLSVETTGSIPAARKDDSEPLGTAVTRTKYTITITEKVPGSFERLEGLAFDVTASSDASTAGSILNEKQFLKLSAKIKLPGGINLDLEDL